MFCFLGLQDAYMNRTTSSQEPEEWEGTLVDSTKGVVTVCMSNKKWGRSEKIIIRIIIELSKGGGLDFKKLEKDRGYLVYTSRTYRSMVPYLKGIHQTLNYWRSDRNADSWKLSLKEIRDSYAERDNETSEDAKAPAKVQAVLRFKSDLFALGELLADDRPYKVPVRVKKNGWVGYGMKTHLEMSLETRSLSMVPYSLNMGSGLVLFLRHPLTIGNSKI